VFCVTTYLSFHILFSQIFNPNLYFSWSIEGFTNFFSAFSAFSFLYGALLTVSGIFLIVQQLSQNIHKQLDDEMKEFEKNLIVIMDQYKTEASGVWGWVLSQSDNIFRNLKPQGFKVKNSLDIPFFINNHILPFIYYLENTTKEYQEAARKYDDVDSYSLKYISPIIERILIPSKSFLSSFKEEYKKLYIDIVKKKCHIS